VVCPVKIPLPDLQRKLRETQMETGMRPWYERAGLILWTAAVERPKLYDVLSRVGVRLMRWMGRKDGLIHKMPIGMDWTLGRDMPVPEGRTFRELYAAQQGNAK
jgi:L-lactate dehydrogenase complex protein LldF